MMLMELQGWHCHYAALIKSHCVNGNDMLMVLCYINRNHYINGIALHYVNNIPLKLITHTMQICGIFDIVNLLQYCPWFAAMLFQWSHAHCQHFSSWICRHCDFISLLPFSSCDFCVILCCNWLKLLYVLPFAWFSACLAASSIHSTISL